MNNDIPEARNDFSHLHLYIGPDNSPSDEIKVDLNEERRHLEEQAEVETYWAGRNLAERHSTRLAA
jgi:hypothetical protein